MKIENIQKCLEDFLTETILNCPESCITEDENQLIITIPEDKLLEFITEEIRKSVYNILENDEFVNKLTKVLSEKRGKTLSGKIVKDISGFILYFE